MPETIIARHTPGPWFIDVERGFPMPVQEKDGIEICRIGGNSLCTDDPGEAEANARLIAAAPKLLAIAKDALDYLQDQLGSCDPGCECLLHPLAAAIGKAEGRS